MDLIERLRRSSRCGVPPGRPAIEPYHAAAEALQAADALAEADEEADAAMLDIYPASQRGNLHRAIHRRDVAMARRSRALAAYREARGA